MPVLKRRTIAGTTYQLKRYSTDKKGKQYEYWVTTPEMSGSFDDKKYYTKKRAKQAFNKIVNDVQKGAGKERNENRRSTRGGGVLGSALGGGGMTGGSDDSDDRDDGFPFSF